MFPVLACPSAREAESRSAEATTDSEIFFIAMHPPFRCEYLVRAKANSIARVRSCLIERVQEQHHCQRRAAASVRTRGISRRTEKAERRTACGPADAAIQKSAPRTKILNRDAGI